MTTRDRRTQKTDYPHIVRIEGVCGGEAIIEGTRIAVWHIVEYYYKVGMSVEEFLAEWNYLKPAAVFSALAYYHDHREEIDRVRQENSYEYWLEHYAHATA
ncbi:MAG: DUF433 domain-containing protein [Chloroflexi bacterium]|nr:DUF433 domain-containing protein [Chloroflexota bacterium]MBI3733674.1 DUF433 domain-containing protein [Chloroflexota bacterium]